ncbi:MAG: VOC family protein [Bacteroidota bacterium]
MNNSLLNKIDHLVYNTTNIHQGIAMIEELTGVAPVIAGRHQGQGTWNALMSLGAGIYFEVIAPDPAQKDIQGPSWLNTIRQFPDNRLINWCVKTNDAPALVNHARQHQIELGEVVSGSREKNDGSTLSWTLTDFKANSTSLLPFFIDWGDSEHPSGSLPDGCSLINLEIIHPEPEDLKKDLENLDLPIKVSAGNERRLLARLNTPKGEVVLL